jgi:hypothetical protein
VEADLRLFRQRLQHAGVVADDHGVTFGSVLEVVKHPFFFEQTLDEVEVGFAILGDVGVALLRYVSLSGTITTLSQRPRLKISKGHLHQLQRSSIQHI